MVLEAGAANIAKAAQVISSGGVIAHATEGVWGLACAPFDLYAVNRILQLKDRDPAKGLLVIGADSNSFQCQLDGLGETQKAEVIASWPGHVTWILPDTRYPDLVTGGRPTLGCRVPDHLQARTLCKTVGGCLVSTSLNRSGESAITTYADALDQFGHAVDWVLPGQVGAALGPSQILTPGGAVLRETPTAGTNQ